MRQPGRYYTNEDLRTILYPQQSPEFCDKLYDLYERVLATTDLEEWGQLLLDITKMHKKMVGCRVNVDIVEAFHNQAMAFIRTCTSSLSVWRDAMKTTSRDLLLMPIAGLIDSHCTDKSCHAPDGSDYICFCPER